MEPVDILILSNGPGELATWVRPVVRALRQQLGDRRAQVRISVILSPCPHATGKEGAIARTYPEIDRVQEAQHFWPFLLRGKTAENWDWREKGVVLFLGGDQFFTLILGKRLGYRTVIYAEREARWQRWIDRFAVMNGQVQPQNSQKYAHKFTIVGDLIADVARDWGNEGEEIGEWSEAEELIGLLPGSKPAKLMQGVPLCLAIAECIHQVRPQSQFVIPVAPTLEIETLAEFANPQQNPVLELVNGTAAELKLEENNGMAYLETASGLRVQLCRRSPAYDLLSQCTLCLTTVGANTAELGCLGIPMIVLLPTQQLDAMRAWDGLPGILANLPLLGSMFAKLINRLVLRQGKLFAWPNIWAGEEIVPELVGKLQPQQVAAIALDWLENPEKLQLIRDKLHSVRGQPGAGNNIAKIVIEEIESQLN
ncbi:lipid-A-disaccharide synthase [Phormidium pseudopriestleyi FRX01]|uniref:Lipid-A-disaccharide synthase n=1 Tax=Phormidium pseudopriestleyi FRX01 TaxID=1759528 RepID=A0ABS3FX23_9CYAN|nr:lipid-A-disaccharide synthase [Phormidium pseudopriestleyi]MBO0351651.1 lipid-A-disaccharide synthase [Phormidium pseudopriestleyi FRX01]